MPKTITLDGVEFILTPVATTTEQPIIEPVQDPNVLHMTVMPKIGEHFYWISGDGTLVCSQIYNSYCWDNHNCYSHENGNIALSILKAKIELQNIATELNAGRVIDWLDWRQDKWTLGYDYQQKTICDTQSKHCQYSDIVCLECLHEIALNRMGREKLALALGIWKIS